MLMMDLTTGLSGCGLHRDLTSCVDSIKPLHINGFCSDQDVGEIPSQPTQSDYLYVNLLSFTLLFTHHSIIDTYNYLE